MLHHTFATTTMESDNQRELEHLLVTELLKRNVLTDIICQCGIESVRVCDNCGKLMREGWLYVSFETYCSDACLAAAHPEENLKELQRQAADDESETYWTAWEG